MSFNIDFDGLDDIKKELEKMQKGVSHNEIKTWCKKIEDEAKLDCPEEYKEYIKLDCETRGILGENGFTYDTRSKEALIHLKKTVQKNLASMSFTTQMFFQELVEDIENVIKT